MWEDFIPSQRKKSLFLSQFSVPQLLQSDTMRKGDICIYVVLCWKTEAHLVFREPGAFRTRDTCPLLQLKTSQSSMPQADLALALEKEAVFSKTASSKSILENSPE